MVCFDYETGIRRLMTELRKREPATGELVDKRLLRVVPVTLNVEGESGSDLESVVSAFEAEMCQLKSSTDAGIRVVFEATWAASGRQASWKPIELSARVGASPYIDRCSIVYLFNWRRLNPGAAFAIEEAYPAVLVGRAIRFAEAEFHRSIVQTVPLLICRFDPDGVVTFANMEFCRTLGFPHEKVIGTPLASFIHHSDQKKFRVGEMHEPELEPRAQEYRFVCHDGKICWVRSMVSTLSDARRGWVHHQLIGVDITRLKAEEAGLYSVLRGSNHLNELRSRFISLASHQFRTPLSVIFSSAELLERHWDRYQPDERVEELRQIERSVNEMNALIDKLLLITAPRRQRQVMRAEPFDLAELCRDVAREIQTASGDFRDVRTTAVGRSSFIVQDKNLVRAIVENLISNARKFSGSDSAVRVSLDFQQDHTRITVEDAGIGIPQEDQRHIFEPFHRGTNAGEIAGSGLGLAIVRGCVDALGGRISLKSTVGQGTSITVILPLAKEQQTL